LRSRAAQERDANGRERGIKRVNPSLIASMIPESGTDFWKRSCPKDE
jgi:hypothetical protein